jgi:hypothetical protein
VNRAVHRNSGSCSCLKTSTAPSVSGGPLPTEPLQPGSAACRVRAKLYRNTPPAEAFGRRGQRAKCGRILVAVSFVPQCQPQGMRTPGGRPPRFGFLGSFRIVPKTVGRRGQSVKCLRISPLVSLAPQPHPHGIPARPRRSPDTNVSPKNQLPNPIRTPSTAPRKTLVAERIARLADRVIRHAAADAGLDCEYAALHLFHGRLGRARAGRRRSRMNVTLMRRTPPHNGCGRLCRWCRKSCDDRASVRRSQALRARSTPAKRRGTPRSRGGRRGRDFREVLRTHAPAGAHKFAPQPEREKNRTDLTAANEVRQRFAGKSGHILPTW